MSEHDYNDTVDRFLEERCCFIALGIEPVNELFDQFKEWCADLEIHPRMVQNFSSAVIRREGVYFDIQPYKGHYRRVFVGISANRYVCRVA
ncbi:MAG: hypothetical protein ACOWWM_02455 [Desulfobacterales bacterium]